MSARRECPGPPPDTRQTSCATPLGAGPSATPTCSALWSCRLCRAHAVAQPIRLSLGSIAPLSAPEPLTGLMQGVTRPNYVSGTGGGLKTKDPNHFQHFLALS